MKPLIVDAVVVDGDIVITEDFYLTKRRSYARKAGDGTVLRIWFETAEQSVKHWQYEYLFGYVFKPVAIETGHTKDEVCIWCKVNFMPEPKWSLTELTFEEMDQFTKQSEEWLRANCPKAFIGRPMFDEEPDYLAA